MNYNANTGGRPALGRKVKRVSDVNAMGYTPSNAPGNLYPNLGADSPGPGVYPQQDFNGQGYDPSQTYGGQISPQMYGFNPTSPYGNPPPGAGAQFGVFGQPIVQDMALQYGQQLANTGKSMLKQEVERFVPVTTLKYYFAVDTKYVVTKVMLLLFPFTHKDWSVKYEQDGRPVQPRVEINAPDLYIPTMAYVTYVLVAGMILGMQQRFSPEQIGILASSALAWFVVELAVYSCALYVTNIKTTLRTLDFLAFSGYKFVGIILSIVVSLVGARTGYYSCLAYTNLALAFFLVRTLKVPVLVESGAQPPAGYYGNEAPRTGHKRRVYFLLFVVGVQPVLAWWLSHHLIGEAGGKTGEP